MRKGRSGKENNSIVRLNYIIFTLLWCLKNMHLFDDNKKEHYHNIFSRFCSRIKK